MRRKTDKPKKGDKKRNRCRELKMVLKVRKRKKKKGRKNESMKANK